MKAWLLAVGLGVSLAFAGTPAVSQSAEPPEAVAEPVGTDAPPAPGHLRIGTKEAPPFAMRGLDGTWEGISIDLLAEMGDRMGFTYELVEVTLEDLVSGVASGDLDASIAAITVTSERERQIDFSHPYFHTGLGVAVASEQRPHLLAVIDALTSSEFLATLGLLFGLLFFVGALAWVAEHKRNPDEFEPEVGRGLLSGFWWAVVTMTTVGYGDKAPITTRGRLIGTVWMFSALILTALFTAQLSAAPTSERIGSRVTAIDDLSRVRVGSVSGSATLEPLRALGVRPTGFADVAEGFRALSDHRIDAFVHDAPLLIYLAGTVEGVTITPLRFAPQDYAIVLPQGAAFRETLNRTLLDVLDSEDWRVIVQLYLGEDT